MKPLKNIIIKFWNYIPIMNPSHFRSASISSPSRPHNHIPYRPSSSIVATLKQSDWKQVYNRLLKLFMTRPSRSKLLTSCKTGSTDYRINLTETVAFIHSLTKYRFIRHNTQMILVPGQRSSMLCCFNLYMHMYDYSL